MISHGLWQDTYFTCYSHHEYSAILSSVLQVKVYSVYGPEVCQVAPLQDPRGLRQLSVAIR